MTTVDITSIQQRANCLYRQDQVEAAFDRMAAEISQQVANKNPIIMAVMIGGMVPLTELVLRLDFPLQINYIHVTRYQSGTRGGEIDFKGAPQACLQGRHVVIVDDIIDKGVTLASVVDYCHRAGAKQVLTAVLVDKNTQRAAAGLDSADVVGVQVPDCYVFGYGLDYKEYFRNATGIYAVAPEDEH